MRQREKERTKGKWIFSMVADTETESKEKWVHFAKRQTEIKRIKWRAEGYQKKFEIKLRME